MPGTTNLLIEILAIGGIGSIWLVLVLAKVLGINHIITCINTYNDFATLATIIAVSIIYQLGWAVNWISWMAFKPWITGYRSTLFKKLGVQYENVRPMIFEKMSESSRKELEQEITEMRLCRANTLNFFIITVVLILYGHRGFPYSVISFLACLVTLFQTIQIHQHHYKKLRQLYQATLSK